MGDQDSNETRGEAANRFIELALSDTRLDQEGACFGGAPLNPLPKRCEVCGFPDLDFVPQPYFVLRGPAMTPAEIREACHGCLLVKSRVKTITELVAPDECRFSPTTFLGTREVAPWWFVVPVKFCRTGVIRPSIPRCSACGEHLSGHPGTEYQQWHTVLDAPGLLKGEVFLSSNWGSLATLAEGGHQARLPIGRSFVCSVRFYRLLRELKVAGIYEATWSGKETPPTDEEVQWVKEQLTRLRNAGVPVSPPGAVSADAQKWFKALLKSSQGSACDISEVRALEKKHRAKLPKSYLEFVQKVGSKCFKRADAVELGEVRVLLPDECDFESFRKGVLDTEDEESLEIDAVVFASGEFGDHLCFDIRKDRKECEVLVFRHEYNCFESYAANFVECLRRLATDELPAHHKQSAPKK